jgi:protein-S-isoprenylcysteine O-methyltransferase Ste14
MRATKFEFEYRFFIIGALFFVGFQLYAFDHVNSAVAVLHRVAPSLDLDSARGLFWIRVSFGCGALLVFLSAALRTWATAYLRTEVVHDASLHSEGLVADGPYRHVRNPLYLAAFPLFAGIGAMASRLGWAFLMISAVIFHYRLILREENELLQTQGESYRAYSAAVPRLWPSLLPKLPSSGRTPRWGQAIAGEMFIWLFGAAELCFAITLNFKMSVIIFVSSFVVYFLAVYLVKRRANQSSPSA